MTVRWLVDLALLALLVTVLVEGLAQVRRANQARPPSLCESCGAPADVILADGSTWCLPCHASAVNLGYGNPGGRWLR